MEKEIKYDDIVLGTRDGDMGGIWIQTINARIDNEDGTYFLQSMTRSPDEEYSLVYHLYNPDGGVKIITFNLGYLSVNDEITRTEKPL